MKIAEFRGPDWGSNGRVWVLGDLHSIFSSDGTIIEPLHFDATSKLSLSFITARVVNLGTTTKLCKRNFVPKPHPGHVVVVSRPKIG